MIALDKGNLLFNVIGIVVPASLMLLNCCFENVEFVLVAAPLGLPLEPRPKEPQHGDGDDYVSERGHAATLSSLSAPRITILSASSGNGRCNALASSHGARIHTSRSSSMVRIDPGKKVLFQFFHLCRQIGISANSVGGILARQNPDVVIRL